jgi:hypothetical protein
LHSKCFTHGAISPSLYIRDKLLHS